MTWRTPKIYQYKEANVKARPRQLFARRRQELVIERKTEIDSLLFNCGSLPATK